MKAIDSTSFYLNKLSTNYFLSLIEQVVFSKTKPPADVIFFLFIPRAGSVTIFCIVHELDVAVAKKVTLEQT